MRAPITVSLAAASLWLGCDYKAPTAPDPGAPVGSVEAPLATETLVVNPASQPVRSFVQNKVGVNVLNVPTVRLAAGSQVESAAVTEVLLHVEIDQGVGTPVYTLDVEAYHQIRVTLQPTGLIAPFGCTVSTLAPDGTRMPMRRVETESGSSFVSSVFDVPGTEVTVECPRPSAESTIIVLVHGRP